MPQAFEGERTTRRGMFVVVGYREADERFMAGLLVGNDWIPVGTFREGMRSEEKVALVQAIRQNGLRQGSISATGQEGGASSAGLDGSRQLGGASSAGLDDSLQLGGAASARPNGSGQAVSDTGMAGAGYVRIQPGICVELSFSVTGPRGLRSLVENAPDSAWTDPAFRAFRLKEKAASCTWNRLVTDNADVLPGAAITHPEKMLWPAAGLDKEAYISYLVQIAPRLLPFLQNRILTAIRFPNGVTGESFYQKNCPKYAPDFIRTSRSEDIDYIVADDLSTLVWLGNQGAIELHVPFQQIGQLGPQEIVLDLDPPGRDEFPLAVQAANEIRAILDSFGIVGYPKVSGGKGLQIHIPLGAGSTLAYEDTRVFTSFVAEYLVRKHPASFTVERLKKKRGGRLYVDYIQHAYGKTIICPYSARGRNEATVAAPLRWEEVNGQLEPEQFTIPSVLERLYERPCPMSDYFVRTNPALVNVIGHLKAQAIRV